MSSEDNTPTSATSKEHTPSLTPKELLEMRAFIENHIQVDEKIYFYISEILEASRKRGIYRDAGFAPMIEYGASTRAWLALIRWARVVALLDERDYVLPDDVKYLAYDILRHRIGKSYEAIASGVTIDSIIREILETVRVP
jgi:MoxR-like ATPase